MSKVTITRDDITGQEIAGDTVPFTGQINGAKITADLSKATADALTELFNGSGPAAMVALFPVAEPVASKTRKPSGSGGTSGIDYAGIRDWLNSPAGKTVAAKLYPSGVPTKGRLSADAVSAHAEQTGTRPATAPAPASVPAATAPAK
jgi:hypothetical protein